MSAIHPLQAIVKSRCEITLPHGKRSLAEACSLRPGTVRIRQPTATQALKVARKPAIGDSPQPTTLPSLHAHVIPTRNVIEARSGPSAIEKEGSIVAVMSLITGSTVGAGVLALPAATAPAGFLPSAAVMCGCWALLTAEAFLLAETNCFLRPKASNATGTAHQIVTLRQMADATLGRPGSLAVSFVYLPLSFSLLTAYIVKAGDIIGAFGIDHSSAAAGFVATLGAVLCYGGQRTVDRLNNGMSTALVVLFAAVTAAGLTHVAPSRLTAVSDWSAVGPAVPVIFLALVYHDLVPVVVSKLGGDAGRVRAALLLGSVVPLVMFLAWEGVMLALPEGAPGQDAMQLLMAVGGGFIGSALQAFSLLALSTSVVGTATGLTSTLTSEWKALADRTPSQAAKLLRNPLSISTTAEAPKLIVWLTVLLPPLLIAVANPDSFQQLLQVAGGYGMAALYGILPPVMVWQLRYKPKLVAMPSDAPSHTAATVKVHSSERRATDAPPEWVPGGKAALVLMCSCAVAVEIGQLARALHVN